MRKLQTLVKQGTFTERRLGRTAGISQPHVHHILKGVRKLTPAAADSFIRALGLNITELLEDSELRAERSRRAELAGETRELMVLASPIGPGARWPIPASPFERLRLPEVAIQGLVSPVAARLAADPRMRTQVRAGDMVILDTDESRRRAPDAGRLYALEWKGESLIRWVRRGWRRLYVAAEDTIDFPCLWESIDAVDLTSVIRAQVSKVPPDAV